MLAIMWITRTRTRPRRCVLWGHEIGLLFVVKIQPKDIPIGPADVGRFPTSVALVGMRDLKDYLAASKDGTPVNPGSPFNIKKESSPCATSMNRK